MRRFWSAPLALLLLSLLAAGPALAQAPNAGNGYNLSWSALDPGNDWSAQVIESVFPVASATGQTAQSGATAMYGSIGAEATVIGQMVGQLTGFVAAIAMAWLCYAVIMQIHRGAETARLLSSGMTTMFLVRLGFAAVMMFPLASGFGTGQVAVVQGALWSIGMSRAVYANVVQAIGPDAMVIATPQIPGTKTIVANLIQDELCSALVNQASNNANLVPAPSPVTNTIAGNSGISGGYVTWSYSLSPGNETGAPVCGSLSLRIPTSANATIAGVNVDMTSIQQQILTSVVQNDIRPTVASVAQTLWQNKQASALAPLMGVLTQATADYTQQLTQQATSITSQLRNALSNAAQARNGNVGLLQNQTQLSALGWTAAGAYYLEFARLNGQTLSLLDATPVVNTPSYQGLGTSLSLDMAAMSQASSAFLTELMTYAQTTDGLDVPGGNAELFSGASPSEDGAGVMEGVFRKLRLNERLLYVLATTIAPTTNMWQDPFSGLVALGHQLIMVSMAALGLAGLLASGTATAATTAWDVLTFNWSGAAATVIGHLLMNFLATPIFMLCMALLIPGLTIAFVLPMIPWVMWMAGVGGWLILVCEAVIAVPLWMLAHMTMQGEGLHGRASEGYALLFNVLFRPTLMLFGLFMGYFVFASMSWLIRQSFGIAAGFVLANGWLVTNVLGIAVLLSIFVMAHVVTALMSFRMISLVPHHVPRLIGFWVADRVDMDTFSRDAALVGVAKGLIAIKDGMEAGAGQRPGYQLGYNPVQYLNGPTAGARGNGAGGSAASGGMDSTTRAATDVPPLADGGDDKELV